MLTYMEFPPTAFLYLKKYIKSPLNCLVQVCSLWEFIDILSILSEIELSSVSTRCQLLDFWKTIYDCYILKYNYLLAI